MYRTFKKWKNICLVQIETRWRWGEVEDGERDERKNRNLVRKKAAGGEMLPGGTSLTPPDLHILLGWWANSRAQLLLTG